MTSSLYMTKSEKQRIQCIGTGISNNGATPENGAVFPLKSSTQATYQLFIPRLDGLPPSWNAYFTRLSGTTLDPLSGLTVLPGTPLRSTSEYSPTKCFHRFPANDHTNASSQYPDVYTLLPVQFLVKADRIPVITPPTVRPSCPPSTPAPLRWACQTKEEQPMCLTCPWTCPKYPTNGRLDSHGHRCPPF